MKTQPPSWNKLGQYSKDILHGQKENLLGTLRSNNATATRTSLKNVNSRSFSIYRNYSFTLTFVKRRRTLLDLNSQGPYLSSEREIKFLGCLFMYFIKRENRNFHVVVVQKRAKKYTKSVMHVQSCCFAHKTYCFFLTFSLPSGSLDLKVPIIAGPTPSVQDGLHLSRSHGYYQSGNGQGKLFFKVRQESENFSLSKGKFKSLKKVKKN